MIVPRMIPGPLRSEVIVTELVPVRMFPRLMLRVVTVVSPSRVTTAAAEILFNVSVLKALTPVMKLS